MGDKNVPVVFNNMMRSLLQGIPNSEVYFDDILLGANTKEEFIKTLKKILERLKRHTATISDSKYLLGHSTMTALGFDITYNNGCKPRSKLREKVPNILNTKQPNRTETMVRPATQYFKRIDAKQWKAYSKYGPNYSDRTRISQTPADARHYAFELAVTLSLTYRFSPYHLATILNYS